MTQFGVCWAKIDRLECFVIIVKSKHHFISSTFQFLADNKLHVVLSLFELKEYYMQCDQIGRFLKLLGNKCSYKSSPNIVVIVWPILNNETFMYE